MTTTQQQESNMIKKTQDLIDALRANSSLRLTWFTGSKPSAPGSYELGGIRVYASAVNGAVKLGALHCIRHDWQCHQYKLASKFKAAA
jgi:hypothetical protein